MPRKRRSETSLKIIAECKSVIKEPYPCPTDLTMKYVAGYWKLSEEVFNLDACTGDKYWERNFIFALLILESEGA